MFRVLLDTEDRILGYLSVNIRHSFLMILGNRVKIETSRYDLTRKGLIGFFI